MSRKPNIKKLFQVRSSQIVLNVGYLRIDFLIGSCSTITLGNIHSSIWENDGHGELESQ
jgi:hypothetical protein